MQAPICQVCLKSDILCAVCSKMFEKGKISQADIKISKFLFELERKAKSLRDAKLIKVIDANPMILIVRTGDGGKIIGKKGSIVKKISREFGKSVKVIEKSDFKSFIQNLFFPVTISGFNTLYTPAGELSRIRIKKEKERYLRFSLGEFKRIAKDVYDRDAEIVFE